MATVERGKKRKSRGRRGCHDIDNVVVLWKWKEKKREGKKNEKIKKRKKKFRSYARKGGWMMVGTKVGMEGKGKAGR